MTYGLWVLSLVVTAHQEITRGLLDQWPPLLIKSRPPSGRTTPRKRKRK